MKAGPPPSRGQVFWAELTTIGRKPWVVVSNNRRNQNLECVLAVRITTTGRYAGMPTVVALGHDDPLAGYVMCDDLFPIFRDEFVEPAGALAAATMRAVNTALKAALAIP